MTTRAILLGATALSLFAAAPAFAEDAQQQASTEQAQPATTPASTEAPASGQAAPAQTPAPAASASGSQTVVVTGTRIRRNAFNSTSAVQVVTNENAVLQGRVSAAETLQGATAAQGSQQINNFFSGFIVEGGPGIQTVGFNSLGPTRTLALINGRRLPPSGVRGQVGAVDLATIPFLAVARSEILPEGASPIYGSDAVGGIFNVITRRDVDGLEISFTGRAPFEGGAEFGEVGVLWGKVEDNWNFMAAASYAREEALKYGDRNFCNADYVFNADTGQRADFIDPRTGQPRCFGIGPSFNRVGPGGNAATGTGTWIADPAATARVTGLRPDAIPVAAGAPIPVGPSAGQVNPVATCVLPTGQVISQALGQCNVLLAVPGYRRIWSPRFGQLGEPLQNQVDYDHPFVQNADISSPSQRLNLYAAGAADLDILGGIEVFGEFIGARRTSQQDRAAQLFFFNVDTALQRDYVYNPFNIGVAPAARITAQPVIVRPANSEQEVTTWQLVGGVRGQTGSGFFGGFLRNGDWEIYAQTSVGEGKYRGTTILLSRIEDSLRTTITNGVASCVATAPSLAGNQACVPVNFFDPRVVRGDLNEAETNWLYADPSINEGSTTYKQTAVEGTISGDVFQVPGASDAVKANFGFYYRNYSINDVPGAVTRTFLRPGVSNQALTTVAGITRGEDSVLEFYTEWSAPLVANQPFIENLELTAAYRYTDYDSYSSNETKKFTLRWSLTPEITVIAMNGTSYRAPALFELYLGDQSGFVSQLSIDPCVNWGLSNNQTVRDRCAAAGVPQDYNGAGASATIITGGGLGTLKEEESESTIYSFVWSPTTLPLNLRVDYWQISVTDQVAQFGAGAIVGACFGDTTGRAAVFCSLITRNPGTGPNPFNINTVQNDYVNINVQEVEGIDLQLDYRLELAAGDLTIASAFRWTNRNASGLFSDTDLFEDQGFIGEPVFNGQVQARFDRGDWTTSWTVVGIGPTRNKTFNGTGNPVITQAPGSYYAYNGVTRVLYKTSTETTIYHNVSVRWRTDDWTVVGTVSNLFDEAPPSVSTGAFFSRLGVSPLTGQYPQFGRAAQVQVVRRF